MSETKVQYAFRLPPEYLERLDVLAEKMQLDRAEVARRALRNGIGELEHLTRVAANPIADTLLRLLTVAESDPQERAEVRRVLTALTEHKHASKQVKKEATA
jgi:predicted DNA-binding protein